MNRSERERLADLDAGLLPADAARATRAAPGAREALDALAATRAELAALRDPPVPPELAARWSAAIRDAAAPSPQGGPTTGAAATSRPLHHSDTPAPRHRARAITPAGPPDDNAPAESPGHDGATDPTAGDPPLASDPTAAALTTPDPTPDGRATPDQGGPVGHRPAASRPRNRPDAPAPRQRARAVPPARSGPRGRAGSGRRVAPWRRPAVVAGLVLALVLGAAALLRGTDPDPGRPGLVSEGLSTVGVHDAAGYDDPARRASCLRILAPPGVAPSAPLLGGRRVMRDGRAGVLLVLGTGSRGVFDVVVVDPGCTTLLAATRVGG